MKQTLNVGRYWCYLPFVLIRIRLFGQENIENGSLPHYCRLHNCILYDGIRRYCRKHFWLETNGLHIPWRYGSHEFNCKLSIKHLPNMGLLQQAFASTVMSVLILEDILAIVMMVMLSAVASGNSPDGGQLIESVLMIGFFLILWFVIGLFAIPSLLRKVRGILNSETLLIVSLGLCFLMAVISTKVGFSAAFWLVCNGQYIG